MLVAWLCLWVIYLYFTFKGHVSLHLSHHLDHTFTVPCVKWFNELLNYHYEAEKKLHLFEWTQKKVLRHVWSDFPVLQLSTRNGFVVVVVKNWTSPSDSPTTNQVKYILGVMATSRNRKLWWCHFGCESEFSVKIRHVLVHASVHMKSAL